MTKVILIGGKSNRGKDTFANFLKDELELSGKKVLIVHFADYLKFLCKQYFGWDGSKSEEGRHILQYVGTDLVREKQPSFWLDQVVQIIRLFENDYDYFMIPDTRFKNELEFSVGRKLWDVHSVRMNRLNFKSPLTEEQKSHKSETDLDNANWDLTINASTLDELMDCAKTYSTFI